MSFTLRDFFYSIYEDMDKHVGEGMRWVGERAETLYESAAGPAIWMYEALQGDWNEERTPAQIAADSVLSVIPFLDLVFDIRDISANCRKLREDPSDREAWLSLCLSLVGLIPVAGSVFKGVLKILLAYVRKYGANAVGKAVDAAAESLELFLHNEKIVRIFGSYDLSKSYIYAAEQIRGLLGKVDARELSAQFRKVIDNFGSLLSVAGRVLPDDWMSVLRGKYHDMAAIRSQLDARIGQCLGPLTNILNSVAGRLDTRALAVAGDAGGAGTRGVTAGGKGASKADGGAAEGGSKGTSRANDGAATKGDGDTAARSEGGKDASGSSESGGPPSGNPPRNANSNADNPAVEGDRQLRWEDMPGKTDELKKALFGERISDKYMVKEQGHTSLLPENRIWKDNLEAKARDAYYIDGIYKNAHPPKTYIITEAKFRSDGKFSAGNLSKTKGSTHNGAYYPEAKQMSDKWIGPRLKNDPGLTMQQKREISKSYERRLLVVDESGKVVKKIQLDALGNAIKP